MGARKVRGVTERTELAKRKLLSVQILTWRGALPQVSHQGNLMETHSQRRRRKFLILASTTQMHQQLLLSDCEVRREPATELGRGKALSGTRNSPLSECVKNI